MVVAAAAAVAARSIGCSDDASPVRMTRFLASVRDAEEAQAVLAAGADIVDLKDPAKGALGAVELPVIKTCVAAVAGRVAVSATVGDLPMDEDRLHDAVHATAACGVDDVKLGIQRSGDPHACFARLRKSPPRAGLILVFFADAMPDFDPVAAAIDAGARGLMLDTAGKQAGSLLDHMAIGDIAGFVEDGRRKGLMVGVAGALRANHVAPLLALSARRHRLSRRAVPWRQPGCAPRSRRLQSNPRPDTFPDASARRANRRTPRCRGVLEVRRGTKRRDRTGLDERQATGTHILDG